MNWIPTALCTLAAVVAWWAATVANRRLNDCERAVNRVRALAGRVTALEGGAESLLLMHRKLSGRFYAAMAERPEPEPEPQLDLIDAPTCDNYRQAQIDGPRSAAAQCQCNYCAGMRESRQKVKAALVPKGNAARVAAIHKGLSQP